MLPRQDLYPGYDVLAKRDSPSWNAKTRAVLDERLAIGAETHRFFDETEWPTIKAVAARIGFASGADAWPTKTDELPDIQDFTDIFVASQQDTIYDLKVEVKPDNRVYFEIPKMDIGQGILTCCAIQMADNLDIPFENLDIHDGAVQIFSRFELTRNHAHPIDRRAIGG